MIRYKMRKIRFKFPSFQGGFGRGFRSMKRLVDKFINATSRNMPSDSCPPGKKDGVLSTTEILARQNKELSLELASLQEEFQFERKRACEKLEYEVSNVRRLETSHLPLLSCVQEIIGGGGVGLKSCPDRESFIRYVKILVAILDSEGLIVEYDNNTCPNAFFNERNNAISAAFVSRPAILSRDGHIVLQGILQTP